MVFHDGVVELPLYAGLPRWRFHVGEAGVLMPGKAYRSLQNPKAYEALKRKGFSKASAARISNAEAPGHKVKRKSAKKSK